MQKESFWITNISKMNVSLADLNLTVKANSSIDLMSKHHYYTKEQLINSAKTGSLFKKRDKIFIRKVAPDGNQYNMIPFVRDNIIPSRARSVFEIKEEKFEELNVSDEIFASENAEIAEMDTLKPSKKGIQ